VRRGSVAAAGSHLANRFVEATMKMAKGCSRKAGRKGKPKSWHATRKTFGEKTVFCTRCGAVRTIKAAALMLLNARGQPLTCFACQGPMKVTHLKRTT
jgi:hypothetical protein